MFIGMGLSVELVDFRQEWVFVIIKRRQPFNVNSDTAREAILV